MRSRHSTLIASLAVAVTVLSAGVAHAAWVKTGAGSGATSATSLVTPALTAARSTTSPTSAIDLSWTDAGQIAGTSYQVRRDGTLIGCSSSPCTDSGLAANTTYSYVVTAKLGEWTKTSASATASTATAATPATTYSLSATPGSITAGTATSVVITAKRADGTTDASYTGAKPVTWSGAAFATSPGGTAPGAASSVTFLSGVSEAVPVTLTTAGTGMTLTASTASVSGSTPVTVMVATASRIAFTSMAYANGSPIANCYITCTVPSVGNKSTVTAKVSLTDQYGNLVVATGSGVTVTLSGTANSISPSSLGIAGGAHTSSGSTVVGIDTVNSSTLIANAGGVYSGVTATLLKNAS